MTMKEKTLSTVHFLACEPMIFTLKDLMSQIFPAPCQPHVQNASTKLNKFQDTTFVSTQLGSNSLCPLWTAAVVYLRLHKPSTNNVRMITNDSLYVLYIYIYLYLEVALYIYIYIGRAVYHDLLWSKRQTLPQTCHTHRPYYKKL